MKNAALKDLRPMGGCPAGLAIGSPNLAVSPSPAPSTVTADPSNDNRMGIQPKAIEFCFCIAILLARRKSQT